MNISIKVGMSIIAVCMMLAGCADMIDSSVGKGPITLSADAEQAFAEYQAKRTPRYFAVSADGEAYYYSYCDSGRCLRQVKTKVIERCESFSDGVPCKIYGSQGNIVWTTDES
jgi:uncharacterized protein RhaS with RHS repeats